MELYSERVTVRESYMRFSWRRIHNDEIRTFRDRHDSDCSSFSMILRSAEYIHSTDSFKIH